ncbi:MAG: hypothetical protein KDK99_21890 [Verrucomicrobiales bacterium]|nr:hypothetical protein [Verrucomicrobiales bacterium]
MAFRILSVLVLCLLGTGCGTVHPAGTLGLVMTGDAHSGPPPEKVDYFEKPALPQNNGPVKFNLRF